MHPNWLALFQMEDIYSESNQRFKTIIIVCYGATTENRELGGKRQNRLRRSLNILLRISIKLSLEIYIM